MAPAPRPPVLIEHVVLDQPAREAPHASVKKRKESERIASVRYSDWGGGSRAGEPSLLVVEALDGADVGADERDLGGDVGLRVAAEEETPPAAALLLVAVLARRVQEEGRARGGEQRGLDVGLRIRRAASSVLGVPRSHRLRRSAARHSQPSRVTDASRWELLLGTLGLVTMQPKDSER